VTYIAFTFAFGLACVAGIQFVYLMFVETANRELKRRVRTLETRCRLLKTAKEQLEAHQCQEAETTASEVDDSWPEVIIDDRVR
jgi:hypothetical protein